MIGLIIGYPFDTINVRLNLLPFRLVSNGVIKERPPSKSLWTFTKGRASEASLKAWRVHWSLKLRILVCKYLQVDRFRIFIGTEFFTEKLRHTQLSDDRKRFLAGGLASG